MATAKQATINSVTSVGKDSMRIVADYYDEKCVSGKFIIVDTGLVSEKGKAVKRAYSLVEVDEDKKQFTCLVKKLWGTPAADYMHALQKGDSLTFSGPWGKFYEQDSTGSVWLIATDTGITACLGYNNSIKNENVECFMWFKEREDYFIEDVEIKAENYETHIISKVGGAKRAEQCWLKLQEKLKNSFPKNICMAGDGEVLLFLQEKLIAEGFSVEQIHSELFFNNPAKKST